jgi:hypothetical protein
MRDIAGIAAPKTIFSRLLDPALSISNHFFFPPNVRASSWDDYLNCPTRNISEG